MVLGNCFPKVTEFLCKTRDLEIDVLLDLIEC